MIASIVDYGDIDASDPTVSLSFKIILLYTMNIIITIVSVYSIPKLETLCVSYSKRKSRLTMRYLSDLYKGIVFVCAIINILCTIINRVETRNLPGLNIIIIILLCFTFLIEVVSIWFAVKDFEVTFSTCCSNRYVVRALHTLAVCHIVWFIHRVGYSLLVAIYFIALAPAQTMATISLIYFVIIILDSNVCRSQFTLH